MYMYCLRITKNHMLGYLIYYMYFIIRCFKNTIFNKDALAVVLQKLSYALFLGMILLIRSETYFTDNLLLLFANKSFFFTINN